MFTQVYFHRTRLAYDYHIGEAMKAILPNGQFPEPTAERLSEYLKWDDWKVLGLLADGQGGDHGDRLRNRNHYREVYHTSEVPSQTDLEELDRIRKKFADRIALERTPGKTWYTIDKADVSVQMEIPGRPIRSLSECSSVVREIGKSNQIILFTRPEHAEEARKEIEEIRKATKSIRE
jgi:HD superfamily phosphohydrolase